MPVPGTKPITPPKGPEGPIRMSAGAEARQLRELALDSGCSPRVASAIARDLGELHRKF